MRAHGDAGPHEDGDEEDVDEDVDLVRVVRSVERHLSESDIVSIDGERRRGFAPVCRRRICR